MLLAAAAACQVAAIPGAATPAAEAKGQPTGAFGEAGDWTLQCAPDGACRLVGVQAVPQSLIGVRTLVIIDRPPEPGAAHHVRLGFMDALGSFAVPPPQPDWQIRLCPQARLGQAWFLRLEAPAPDGGYAVNPDRSEALVQLLRACPVLEVRDREGRVASLPKGNLAALMDQMDRFQASPGVTERLRAPRPPAPPVLRGVVADERAVPPALRLPCSGAPAVNQPAGYRLGTGHHLWIADCLTQTRLFLEADSAAPVPISDRLVTPAQGRLISAGIWDDGLLTVRVAQGDATDCGHRMVFGFDGTGFVLLSQRTLLRCRTVPAEFWPLVQGFPDPTQVVGLPSRGGDGPRQAP
jgi:hypothetical protein